MFKELKFLAIPNAVLPHFNCITAPREARENTISLPTNAVTLCWPSKFPCYTTKRESSHQHLHAAKAFKSPTHVQLRWHFNALITSAMCLSLLQVRSFHSHCQRSGSQLFSHFTYAGGYTCWECTLQSLFNSQNCWGCIKWEFKAYPKWRSLWPLFFSLHTWSSQRRALWFMLLEITSPPRPLLLVWPVKEKSFEGPAVQWEERLPFPSFGLPKEHCLHFTLLLQAETASAHQGTEKKPAPKLNQTLIQDLSVVSGVLPSLRSIKHFCAVYYAPLKERCTLRIN